jgi:hypothetical protein
VPEAHVLDLTLSIDPSLVLIESDGMKHVFSYNPLVAEIDRLTRDGQYDTGMVDKQDRVRLGRIIRDNLPGH